MMIRIELARNKKLAETRMLVLQDSGFTVERVEECQVAWVNDQEAQQLPLVTYAAGEEPHVYVVVGRK